MEGTDGGVLCVVPVVISTWTYRMGNAGTSGSTNLHKSSNACRYSQDPHNPLSTTLVAGADDWYMFPGLEPVHYTDVTQVSTKQSYPTQVERCTRVHSQTPCIQVMCTQRVCLPRLHAALNDGSQSADGAVGMLRWRTNMCS